MKKRKIRVIVNAIPLMNINTGIGRYLKCLYDEMTRLYADRLDIGYFDGSTVSAAAPHGPTDLDRWSVHVDRFWRLPSLPAVSIRLAVQLYREVLFHRASKGYEIYHEAAFFPFIGRPDLKTVFTVHDLSLQRFPQYHPKERVLFCRLFFRKRWNKADHFLTVSHFTKREMETYLAPLLGSFSNRLTVTPLAHDPQTFHPRSSQEVEAARARFGLPERYFIFVGTGDPRKNVHIIPEALRRAGLSIPLAVAGWRGWSQSAASESRVIPLGYVTNEELARLYSGALALVYPSLYEGFGLPVVEAMACGCPILCSRMASLPEVAAGAALYLENPFDSDELATLLKASASDGALRHSLSERSLARASEFSWEKSARTTFRLFERLLE